MFLLAISIFPPFTFDSSYKTEAFINTCFNNYVITFWEMCLLFVLGCEFHDVSFGPGQTKGSWSSELHPDRENWSFYSYIGGGHTGTVFPSTIRNPNKAICTINSKTSEVMKRPVQPPKFMIMMHKKLSSTFFLGKKPPKTWFWLLLICVFQILTANDMTCELFGYETEELLGKKLKDLIKLKPKEQATIQECHFDESSGNIVSLAGKVVSTAISLTYHSSLH